MKDIINIYMDDVRPGPFCNVMPESGFLPDLPDWMDWITVRSVANVKRFLEMGIVNKLSLDHDMGTDETGYDLAKWMAETGHWPKGQIWVHSANPVGRDNIVATVRRYHPDSMEPFIGEPFEPA